SAASSAADQRESGRPEVAGSSQASAFTSAISAGGKRPGTPRPGPLVKPRQPLLGEASSPLGHRLVGAVQAAGDLGVGVALGGQQHDPGPDDLAMGPRVLPGPAAQLPLLTLAETDRGAGHRHQIRRPRASSSRTYFRERVLA